MAKGAFDWKKLLTGHCPQCGSELEIDGLDNRKCYHCGFFCHQAKANKIVFDIQLREKERERKRLANSHLMGYDVV